MMSYMLLGGLLVLLARTQASLASTSNTPWINATENIPNSSNSSSSCELYTVRSGDTCFGISLDTNISYAQVMAWNPEINLACTNLAKLTSICISNPSGNFTLPTSTGGSGGFTTPAPIPSPTVGGSNTDCGEWHKVVSGDDCGTIATAYGITSDQFRFLNPEVNSNCTNLWLNYYYCVEPVGSISTYSGYQSTATTTRTTRSINQTLTTPLPYVANIWENYTSSLPTIPLANGTRIDCTEYTWFRSEIFVNNSAITDCWALARVYGISRKDFILWNPSLAQGPAADGSVDSASSSAISSIASSIASAIVHGGGSTTAAATATTSKNLTLYNVTITENYAYSCTVAPSSSYCLAIAPPMNTTTTATVSTPSPVAPGEAANCTEWFAPQSFDTCQSVLSLFGLTIAELYAMNPSVGSDCTGMALNTYYCVSWYPDGQAPSFPDDSGTGTISTPSPIQTGMVSSCDAFYKVVKGDSCNAIADKCNITAANFHAWNPAVGSSCTMLIIDDYVCVGVLPSNTTTTTTTASTRTGVVTPSPIQTGMVSNCGKFYQVKSGDGCPSVASEFSISVSNLHAWNPAIGSSCTMLIIGDYVCVGVASHTIPVTTTPPRV